jgi:hypothetical protein
MAMSSGSGALTCYVFLVVACGIVVWQFIYRLRFFIMWA